MLRHHSNRGCRVTGECLESLEQRRLLSAALVGDVLLVQGGRRSDLISINTRDGGVTIRATINGARSYFTAAQVRQIDVIGYRGNDRIEIAESLSQPVMAEGD